MRSSILAAAFLASLGGPRIPPAPPLQSSPPRGTITSLVLPALLPALLVLMPKPPHTMSVVRMALPNQTATLLLRGRSLKVPRPLTLPHNISPPVQAQTVTMLPSPKRMTALSNPGPNLPAAP